MDTFKILHGVTCSCGSTEGIVNYFVRKFFSGRCLACGNNTKEYPDYTQASHALKRTTAEQGLAQAKFKTITLCGSTKFKEEFDYYNKKFTIEGHVVFSVGFFRHELDSGVEMDTKLHESLMAIHRRKIFLSDEVFVINKNGYIGSGLFEEITYANSLCKSVVYMEVPKP